MWIKAARPLTAVQYACSTVLQTSWAVEGISMCPLPSLQLQSAVGNQLYSNCHQLLPTAAPPAWRWEGAPLHTWLRTRGRQRPADTRQVDRQKVYACVTKTPCTGLTLLLGFLCIMHFLKNMRVGCVALHSQRNTVLSCAGIPPEALNPKNPSFMEPCDFWHAPEASDLAHERAAPR